MSSVSLAAHVGRAGVVRGLHGFAERLGIVTERCLIHPTEMLRIAGCVPAGEAELIVLTESPARPGSAQRFKAWLDSWIRTLPASSAIPLETLCRENLYE